MRSFFQRAGRWLVWAVLLFMVVSIVRTALADPSTTPRDADREKAGRTLDSPGELRLQRVEGQWIGALGTVEPASPERTLAPATAGRIVAIPVVEGLFVEAGAVLMELESDLEQAALAAAEAEVVGAELELRRTRGSARTEDLQALRREASAAEVRAEQSASSYERLQATVAAGGVSPEEVERQGRQAEQDALAAQAAASRRRSAEEGRPIDVRVAQAALDGAIARRDQARASLELKRIVAPIAGEVLSIANEVGETVQPTSTVVVMGDTRTLRARVEVDERDVTALVKDGRAILTVDALPNQRFEGRIVSVGNRMGRRKVNSDDPADRVDTRVLEVVIDLGSVDLIIGQRVMAYLEKAG